MFYFNDPILYTDAEVLVVPVRTDGKIVPGTFHAEVNEVVRRAYPQTNPYEVWYETCRKSHVLSRKLPTPCEIGEGLFKRTVLFNLPSVTTPGVVTSFSDIVRGMVLIVRHMKKEGIETVAIPSLSKCYTWEAQEGMLENVEIREGDGKVSFWVYPTEGEVPKEEEDGTGVTVDNADSRILVGSSVDG